MRIPDLKMTNGLMRSEKFPLTVPSQVGRIKKLTGCMSLSLMNINCGIATF